MSPVGPFAGISDGVAMWSLLVATGALLLYWVTVGRILAAVRPALLWTTTLAGGVALVAQAGVLAADLPVTSTALVVASFLTSAALLGGACTAIILGHWYLVLPSMDVSLLQSIVKFHIGSTIVRVAVVGAAVFMAVVVWEPGMGPSFQRYIFSSAGVFFW